MHRMAVYALAWGFLAIMASGVATQAEGAEPEAPKIRTFRFDYAATVHGLPAGSKVRVWLPVPSSNEHQQVDLAGWEMPAEIEIPPISIEPMTLPLIE